ncbi:beta-N-acetylhexosaminidase [Bailinhaonella thermotolerans]|uniref:beta-N-acetylhexosaminidase n=1 Tax=Bailinhaonella thermotolerans TaxID=1070861 RepID=A0A3A4APC6_9ACTN|nr:beta-N-acetylhexosaminidase [Bailinhaonella thermotolerans]RJL30881.1 beta-N-acetylhexosaminidase [Bailinhaonella thermotolerans]
MIIPRPRSSALRDGSVAVHPGLVRLAPHDPALGEEGYRVEAGPPGVLLTAGGPAGRFYGLRTLEQFGPAVPYGTIEDRPRYGWRGVLLDVARHFMPKEFVLRLIDLIAAHKLNVLHLHLTDDQGWRLEIKRYPRLTEVGAAGGGFYTREDVAEIVAHAAERFVTVVPEIEMPGHAQAAIAAYPRLGNHPDRRLGVWDGWGISEHVFNLEESTLAFCRDVLDEVIELFPGEFVHVGGEECPHAEWAADPRALRRIGELGLSGPEAARGWFVGRMAEHLAARGRRLVSWDDPAQPPPPGTTAMVWLEERAGPGRDDVVLTPHTRTYLDYRPSPEDPGGLPAPAPVLPLAEVYGFAPDPGVRGVQCQLWTEYMPAPERVEYMAFPRLCAFAEVAWGTAGDYGEFLARLGPHLDRLRAQGVNAGPLIP